MPYICCTQASCQRLKGPEDEEDFDLEFLYAYKAGSKNTLLDGRLQDDGNVFYCDYQVNSFEALINNLNERQTHRIRILAFFAPDTIEQVTAGDIPNSLSQKRLALHH